MTTRLPGLARTSLDPWLTANVAGAEPPYTYELIAAGGSNLTYRVNDAAGTVRVLRRPPEGRALQSAHDMEREARIIGALGTSTVPVPDLLARCADPSVTGAEFYVMSFVDGLILRDQAAAATLSPADCATATASLVHTQVAFHTIDLASAGLADLGRHHGYVARQLKRWLGQVQAGGTRELPLLHDLHRRLEASIPPERVAPGLAHGDYRFDNTVLGPHHHIAAVLDWELCTTGDPIADFAWSAQYWADPGDEFTWLTDPPTMHPAFPRRTEMIEQYRRASGFDLSDLPWYEAFSWWKQACIVEGVYGRRLAGAGAGAPSGPIERIAARAETMLERAHELVQALD